MQHDWHSRKDLGKHLLIEVKIIQFTPTFSMCMRPCF